MSAIETLAQSRSIHSGPARGFFRRQGAAAARLLNTVSDRVSVMLERRRSRLALLGLTDDQLKDIGLSRADAHREGIRPFFD
ncbi:DUF1127 domain-containing protein [Kumtagia ephedrae]|uniref:YjiS-like domain-containing protein n=1 Tax=Kumtagia ephedrae TaxID=2116701 RepID=A0A2P7ST00_9HYPH|nr:DUF1127 domain-containing protein [Mesorhizobium ephedrae]PSJ65619.1 hypothetical protein C7I84_00360 [Mesorhizobium ephedrae]